MIAWEFTPIIVYHIVIAVPAIFATKLKVSWFGTEDEEVLNTVSVLLHGLSCDLQIDGDIHNPDVGGVW